MNSSCPSVCICIPTYNAEVTIKETLVSALAQDYPNFTIRIFDNASTDRTLEIIESFQDERISIFRSDRNIGAIANFDRCISVVEGTYTEMFHADEVYEPDMVSRQVVAMEARPEAGAAFTEAYLIDSASRVFGETTVAKYIGAERGTVAVRSYEELLPAIYRAGNFLLCSGALVRTKIYQEEIVRWRGDMFSSSCDLDVWLRILEQHSVLFVLDKLMRTRTSRTQASYTEIKRNTARADMFLVLDHYLDKPRSQRALTASDIAGYAAMQRMDRARRAMNLYLLGRKQEAVPLLNENLGFGIVSYAFRSKRGLLTLLLTVYLRSMIALGADRLGKKLMQFADQKVHR
ncbi:MAG: glycosyl transferase family 2 [Rhodocyclales bacterium]|nr:glycosyl transferase family 2 [Rhodocyclales bacterium]